MLALDSLNITLLHLSHVISCYCYCCRCLGLGGLDEILLLDRPARLDRASQRAFPRFNRYSVFLDASVIIMAAHFLFREEREEFTHSTNSVNNFIQVLSRVSYQNFYLTSRGCFSPGYSVVEYFDLGTGTHPNAMACFSEELIARKICIGRTIIGFRTNPQAMRAEQDLRCLHKWSS